MKVNLHITEKCNYQCKQCFAKFGSRHDLGIDKWKSIVQNCIECGISSFNIAGGEPFIYPHFNELVEFIYDCGTDCSIITNASLLTKDWVHTYGKMINTLGISIDSIKCDTNAKIGRQTKSGKQLDVLYLKECLNLLREINPSCRIKINTVVSKLNYNEYLFDFIKECNCGKWKLLRMYLFNNGEYDNSALAITDEEYETFIRNNISNYNRECYDVNQNKVIIAEGGIIVVIENDMESAYLIIDARGFLVDNVHNKYTDVIDCTKESFSDGMNKMIFNDSTFWSRYDLSE